MGGQHENRLNANCKNAYFNITWLADWLSWAAHEKVLPDVLTWHEKAEHGLLLPHHFEQAQAVWRRQCNGTGGPVRIALPEIPGYIKSRTIIESF